MNMPASRPCKVEDCSTPVGHTGGYDWCSKHYQRWKRHGDPLFTKTHWVRAALNGDANPNWSEEPSYHAAHFRVTRANGAASTKSCADCGQQAAHWSYDNADASELVDPKLGRYSSDPDHYQPRCVPCHSAFDASARAALLTGERP